MSGSESGDPDGDSLTYKWRIALDSNKSITGTSIVTTNATDINTSFTPSKAGDYFIELVVNDGTVNSPPATITVNVEIPPSTPDTHTPP